MPNLCIKCKKEPIFVKKRQLCKNCYQAEWREENKALDGKIKEVKHYREIAFIKNFFTHQNWYYAPIIFRANGFRYEPDFYDNKRNVFIEVSGTRQAFEANRDKYIKFAETFPHLRLEIRKTDGVLIDINERQTWPVGKK